MDDASAFAEEIEDAAPAAIRSAIDGLEVKPEADKTAPENTLDKAAKLKKSDYTAASWKTLTKAVEKGRQVLDDKKASDKDIADAAASIQKAMDNLKKVTKTNTAALKSALDKAAKLKQSDYTASSWKNLTKAVDAGKKVLNNKKLLRKILT